MDDDPIEIPIDGVLDLHNFRPREVRDLVSDYLDACRARGITEVRIVHGKGTGALQRTVHALLARRSDVLHHALAPAERGGWGATLVTLRPALLRVVRSSEWTAAPWRNGGGVTHEIAREGPPDGFSWRVSVADVAKAGPFSAFPGVDRVIALVEGDGFVLGGVRLDKVGEPHAFPGDVPVDCTLVGGPVRDLNFMVDRARWRIACKRHDSPVLLAADPLLLAFVLDGKADVEGLSVGRHDLVISERDLRVPVGVSVVVAGLHPLDRLNG